MFLGQAQWLAYSCKHRTQEIEAGGFQVQGLPGTHREISSFQGKHLEQSPALSFIHVPSSYLQAFNNTYLFYGAYRAGPESSSEYSIRLAYLLSPMVCLLLCFCGILQR